MSSRATRFQVKFEQDGSGAVVASFDKIEAAAKETERALNASEKSAYEFGLKLGSALKWTGGAVLAGMALIVRNTMAAEQELAQLDAVLKSTGQSANFSRDQLIGMADGIAQASTFSAGEITKAETRLLSYSGIARGNFRDALQVAIDQATRLGISVEQSSEIVGRALESPTKAAAALAQQGFGAAFTDAVRKSIKALEDAGKTAEAQQIVLDILKESYGGAAAEARDTFGGALVALKNTLADVTTGGNGSLDGATKAVNELVGTLGSSETREAFASITTGATTSVQALVEMVLWLKNAWQAAQQFATIQIGGFKNASGDQFIAAQRNEADQIRAELARRAQGGGLTTAANRLQTLPLRAFGAQGIGGSTDNELRTRLAALEHRIDQNVMLFGDPSLQRMFFSDETTIPDSMLYGSRPGATTPKASTAKTKKPTKQALTEEERAAKQLADTYQRLVDQQNERIALVGKEGDVARIIYRTTEGDLVGLSEKQKQVLVNLTQTSEAMDAFYDIYEGPNNIFSGMEEKAKDTFDAMSEFAKQAGRNMQDIFADFLFNPFEDGVDGMLDNFARVLMQMAAQAASAQLFDSLGKWGNGNSTSAGGSGWKGMLGNIIGSLFGGGKAVGGTTQGGTLYEVGEGGRPEVFRQNGRTYLISGNSGEVVPAMRGATAAAGGGNVVVQINNSAGGRVSQREETGAGADGTSLRKIIIDIVADDMAGGGRTAAATRGRFGLGG